MVLTVRRLGVNEWPLLKRLRLEALREAPYAYASTSAEAISHDDEWWISIATRFGWFVSAPASKPAEAVGLVAGVPGVQPGITAVISMWVAPSHRGRGVAVELLDAVERWARAEGAVWLTLGVSKGNEQAMRFFRRVGFSLTGETEPLHSHPTALSLRMRKPLPPARLRFAPGSSKLLHVGHARIALWTWILARRYGGDTFVRFEDTDPTKLTDSQQAVLEDLAWLGLEVSQPPLQQRRLSEDHARALDALTAGGFTYRDGGAVRFRLPRTGLEVWEDLARGLIKIPTSALAEPVLLRSDGSPTFFLASTVDDISQAVTHLVRVSPMLAASATQRHMWRTLQSPVPEMAHIPEIRGLGGISLRSPTGDGTLRALRERGVGAEALQVYLTRPQAASEKPPPQGLEEIIDELDLRRLSRRPFCFNEAALDTLNQRQIRTAYRSHANIHHS
jgi:ribosomal protein S18 acetylase RimI-like enzyme